MAHRCLSTHIKSCKCGLKPHYEKAGLTEFTHGYKLVCNSCKREALGYSKEDARQRWNSEIRRAAD